MKKILLILFLILPNVSFSQNTLEQELRKNYGIEKVDNIYYDYSSRNRFDVIKNLSFLLNSLEEINEIIYLAEIKDNNYFLEVEIIINKEIIEEYLQSTKEKRKEIINLLIDIYL